MKREDFMRLGADIDLAEKLAEGSEEELEALRAEIVQLKAAGAAREAEHAAEMRELRIGAVVEKALTRARAKNADVVKALLKLDDVELGEDGAARGIEEQIEALAAGEETRFLFEEEKLPIFKGFQPGVADAAPGGASMDYEARLAEARKTGDMLGAIRVKQEAAAEGVVLM